MMVEGTETILADAGTADPDHTLYNKVLFLTAAAGNEG
jgi:hypothetical protein